MRGWRNEQRSATVWIVENDGILRGMKRPSSSAPGKAFAFSVRKYRPPMYHNGKLIVIYRRTSTTTANRSFLRWKLVLIGRSLPTVLATSQILSAQLVAPRVGGQRMITQKCRHVFFGCELMLLLMQKRVYLIFTFVWKSDCLCMIESNRNFLKVNCFHSEN